MHNAHDVNEYQARERISSTVDIQEIALQLALRIRTRRFPIMVLPSSMLAGNILPSKEGDLFY
jgi:hypothetical protein